MNIKTCDSLLDHNMFILRLKSFIGSIISYPSKTTGGKTHKKTKLEIATQLAFPTYYVDNVVINHQDVSLTTNSWNILMNGGPTIPFTRNSQHHDFNYSTSLSWFFDIFYERFFDLCPETRLMFAHVSIVSQGKLLAGVISSSLTHLSDTDRLKTRLLGMVKAHNGKGVKASYYGCMGDALVWALETVIGEDFSSQCKLSWYRVYSYLLSIILPEVVKYEIEMSRRSITWVSKSRSNSYSFTNSVGRRIEAELDRALLPKNTTKSVPRKTMPVTVLVHCNS